MCKNVKRNKQKKNMFLRINSYLKFLYWPSYPNKKAQPKRISRHSQGWVRRTRIPFLAAWFCFLLFSRSLPQKCCSGGVWLGGRWEALCTPGHQAQLVLAVGRVACRDLFISFHSCRIDFPFPFANPAPSSGNSGEKHNQEGYAERRKDVGADFGMGYGKMMEL